MNFVYRPFEYCSQNIHERCVFCEFSHVLQDGKFSQVTMSIACQATVSLTAIYFTVSLTDVLRINIVSFQLFGPSNCGNLFIEEGEECDCGTIQVSEPRLPRLGGRQGVDSVRFNCETLKKRQVCWHCYSNR